MRLGPPKVFRTVKPGDFMTGMFRKPLMLQATGENEEDIEEENLPTAQNLPPFERLVLWTDPADPENKIEVKKACLLSKYCT